MSFLSRSFLVLRVSETKPGLSLLVFCNDGGTNMSLLIVLLVLIVVLATASIKVDGTTWDQHSWIYSGCAIAIIVLWFIAGSII